MLLLEAVLCVIGLEVTEWDTITSWMEQHSSEPNAFALKVAQLTCSSCHLGVRNTASLGQKWEPWLLGWRTISTIDRGNLMVIFNQPLL